MWSCLSGAAAQPAAAAVAAYGQCKQVCCLSLFVNYEVCCLSLLYVIKFVARVFSKCKDEIMELLF